MFKSLSSSVSFLTSLADYGGIHKLIESCYVKAQKIFSELAEIQYDIKNMSYSTGLIILLFVIIDILILLIVFHYFRRKESYEKISKIAMIIAIIIGIYSFIYGYSFYDQPYANEYSISPYSTDAKNFALVGVWFGLQGFLIALTICQAVALMIAWLNKPSKKSIINNNYKES